MRKSYRVKSEKDFQKVFQTRQSVANRAFIIYQLEKPNQKHFRVGLSVGKKIGNAVVRNRVKRLLRVAVQQLDPKLPATLDFIIIARPGVDALSQQEVLSNLEHVLKLAKII
jgi:ribonuclease P protein component